MFAALFFERDPLKLTDLPAGFFAWVQIAGGFALFGIVLWLAFGLARWKPGELAAVPSWQKSLFLVGTIVAILGYLAGAGFSLLPYEGPPVPPGVQPPQSFLAFVSFTAGGLGGLLAAGLPFLLNLPLFSIRRILALAGLSFKEAIRRRVLVVFSALLLVFLFGSWFITGKPEDQLRTYIGVLFTAMGWLLLIAAALVSAFSIPADIRQQTIHTIVTKPVERFEIVLGRFLGFYALLTLVLLAMSTVGLLYVLRGINPEAVAESLKAREPLYGYLSYENTEGGKGISVGREWEYRGYITTTAEGQPVQRARWDFYEIPAVLGTYPTVMVEYTFDVYRTTKGKEGQDVACDFVYTTASYVPGNDKKFRDERKIGNAKLDDELAQKYGYYEVLAQPVTDQRTQSFRVPGGLFRNAAAAKLTARPGEPLPPRLQLRVSASRRQTQSQYVGMAKYDFFLRLDSTDASAGLFALNYYKAVFGLWMQLGLVIGLAVVLSTYLNGIITLLVVACLMLGGSTREFVKSVGLNQNTGGGPGQAMRTILSRQVTAVKSSDSESASDQVVDIADEGFRWLVRRVLNVLPETDRFDTERYLAEGFNIPLSQMFLHFAMLVGYLVPWFILSYYLLRWREVASST